MKYFKTAELYHSIEVNFSVVLKPWTILNDANFTAIDKESKTGWLRLRR